MLQPANIINVAMDGFHDKRKSVVTCIFMSITFYIRTNVLRMRLTLGLRAFLQSVNRLLKLATKPGQSELWQSMKICILGIAVVGVVGFVIKLISMLLQGF